MRTESKCLMMVMTKKEGVKLIENKTFYALRAGFHMSLQVK
jgi:hypothetical protein